MKFRVKGGSHRHFGTIYQAGDIFESEIEMDKKFINKFERADLTAPVSPGTPAKQIEGFPGMRIHTNPEASKEKVINIAPPTAEPKEEIEVPAPEAKPAVITGGFSKALCTRDVTSMYKEAVNSHLQVFKKGQRYYVYEPDAGLSLNPKEGLLKKEIVSFIREYLKG